MFSLYCKNNRKHVREGDRDQPRISDCPKDAEYTCVDNLSREWECSRNDDSSSDGHHPTGCPAKHWPLLIFEFLGFLGVYKFLIGHFSTAHFV